MTGPNRKRAGGPPRGGRRDAPRAAKTPREPVEPLHPTADAPDIQSFRHWELGEAIQETIAAMGIQVPTPIQRLAIGPVLEGRDVIAKAETGTGKTLAFGAPMMAKIDPGRASVLGLVLTPTRELAQQVAGVLEKLGAARGISVALIVGGEPMHAQVEALKKGAQVVVGTPGRVLDLYNQRFLSFPWTEFVVLDEADEMLEIGFIDDVEKILSFTPEERQTLHFSATFPHEVLALSRKSTRDPVELATAAGVSTVATIQQSFMEVDRDDRPLALTRLIEQSAPEEVLLVFCDRRTEVDLLMRKLSRLPFGIKALHGGYDQPSRFRVMSAFRTGEVKALVATDVASRGLDVHQVSHVINYSVPQDAEDYTHRIGRTGRAGRTGKAITFVTPEHGGRWRQIVHALPWTVEQEELPGRYARPRNAPAARPEPEEPVQEEAREPEAEARPRRRPARAARPERQERPRPARREEPAARPGRGSERARETERKEPPQRERPARREPAAHREPAARHEEAPRHAGLIPHGRVARPKREVSTRDRLRQERGGEAAAEEPRSAPTGRQRPSSAREESPRGKREAPAREPRAGRGGEAPSRDGEPRPSRERRPAARDRKEEAPRAPARKAGPRKGEGSRSAGGFGEGV